MKKILTIAATALLSTIAGTAHAQQTGTVTFPAVTVGSSCDVTASSTGALAVNATPPTALNTFTPGTVTVKCNGGTSIDLAVGAATVLEPQTPTATVSVGFSGGTGIFAGASGISAPLTTSTDGAGDVANISASVNAPANKLLKKGSYSVVVVATITAQ